MPDPKPSTPLPPQPESIPLHMDFKAVWVKPEKVEGFLFPFVEVSIGYIEWETGEFLTKKMSTLGAHDPSEILVALHQSMVHHNMGMIRKPLFTALSLILDSSEYHEAHDEWRRWKGQQPSNFHDRIIKKSKGLWEERK